jgi:hypothetical protein
MAIVAHIAQDRQQVVQIVPVDRPDIVVEAELLEHGAAGDIAAGVLSARVIARSMGLGR